MALDFEVSIMRIGWRWRLRGGGRWHWALTGRGAEQAAARAGSQSARLIVEARQYAANKER